MARRTLQTFSASPKNVDALLVLGELAKLPRRQRSESLWLWAANYLRGQARQTSDQNTSPSQDVLDAIADLLGDL